MMLITPSVGPNYPTYVNSPSPILKLLIPPKSCFIEKAILDRYIFHYPRRYTQWHEFCLQASSSSSEYIIYFPCWRRLKGAVASLQLTSWIPSLSVVILLWLLYGLRKMPTRSGRHIQTFQRAGLISQSWKILPKKEHLMKRWLLIPCSRPLFILLHR